MINSAPARPTRVRYVVVAFSVSLAVITYIDRAVLSEAAPIIGRDLKIGKVELGYVWSAFALAYGIFEIPWGWLGDRIGPRRLLMRIVVWWSFFTAATGFAWNSASLLTTQALFGAGEAGCFPNIAKAFTAWLTARERVRAQGILWLSARWGAAFTPLLVEQILRFASWRVAFGVFAALGVVWAVLFYFWYRDDPRTHPGVNALERELLRETEELTRARNDAVPWGRFFRARSVWLLCGQYFFLAYGAIFYITLLPSYLREARHLKLQEGAFLAAFPFFFAGLGSLFCGFILARLARWLGSPGRARRAMALIGFFSASALIPASASMENAVLAMCVMGLAGFANDLAMPPSWAASMDLGGRHAGTLSACMNMMSCLGAAASSWVSTHLLEWSGNRWDYVLYSCGGAYLLGGLFWIFLDPVTPVDRDPAPGPDQGGWGAPGASLGTGDRGYGTAAPGPSMRSISAPVGAPTRPQRPPGEAAPSLDAGVPGTDVCFPDSRTVPGGFPVQT